MTQVSTDTKLIDELITRSIDTIYPSAEELRKKLLEGKQLKAYVGIDPTAPYVHIGHATNYLLLERLHQLGHKVIVLVGDFTAMVGDPSDKTSARVQLTNEQVQENLRTFKQQIGKILPFDDRDNPIEFQFNSKWLSSLTFKDAVELASNFTVQQMVERDAFQKRLASHKPLYVHEFFYPLMQGYDSVAMDVDIEVGGTDQTFNMLAGRTLLKKYKDKQKFVITTTLLVNPVTNEKLMSKSLGTGVGLSETPKDMFAKIMRLPDEGIVQCFVDCTRLPMKKVNELAIQLKSGENPRNLKLYLSSELVGMYHGNKASEDAKKQWVAEISNKEIPQSIKELEVHGSPDLLTVVCTMTGASKSEARRLIQQRGVKVNGQAADNQSLKLRSGDIVQSGKKHFAKIRYSSQ